MPKGKSLHLVLNTFEYQSRVLKEVRTLARSGYDVKVLSLLDPEGTLQTNERIDGVDVERIRLLTRTFPRWKTTQLVKYFEYLYRVSRVVKEFRPDIIHCYNMETLPIGVLLKHRRKLVYEARELEAGRQGQGMVWSLLTSWLERRLAPIADCVITVNKEIAGIMNRKLSLANVKVITNSQEIPKKNLKPFPLRKTLQISEDSKIVIYPGKLAEGRGLLDLLSAAPLLDQKTYILIIGYGPLKNLLQRRIEQSNLSERVFLMPAVSPDEIPAYIASSDLGVVPTENSSLSYHYGLGNKFFHFMSVGIPMAVSEQPAKARLIREHEVGVLFQPGNHVDIAKAINGVLGDRIFYNQLRENSLKAGQTLSWNTEEKRFLEIYETLMEDIL